MSGVKRKAPSSSSATADGGSSTPALNNKILRNRLLTGLGSKWSARGSLTKCATRVGEFLQDKTKKDVLIRELRHQKLEMVKLALQLQRQQMELAQVQLKTQKSKEQSARESLSVQKKRQELQQQLEVTACEREYEALAKLAAHRHPTSRRVLEEQYEKAKQECREGEEQLQKLKAETSIRQGQFQLLLQCMLDLKQSLKEPLTSEDLEEHQQDDKKEESEEEEGQAMEVDEKDEDLYGDL